MIKRILIAVLFAPLLALAQSYPSPTFNNLTVLGTFTASGNIGLPSLATQAANTVVANATASSASPTAVAMPSCSTANSMLQWTAGTGFNCVTNSALTTGTLAQFASTTSAQLAGVLSDETGTGAAVFASSPTLVTPVLGTPTSATLTNATGLPISTGVSGLGTGVATGLASAATGTGGPVLTTSPSITTPVLSGVVSGACAAAGKIGECINSNVPSGSAISLTSGAATNITSVSLTAGNWLCYGIMGFLAAGSTVTSLEAGWISSASATNPGGPNFGAYYGNSSLPATAGGNANVYPLGMIMENITTTTTIFLSVLTSFTTSTLSGYGYINCIRWH